MNAKQRLLKYFYPLLKFFNRWKVLSQVKSGSAPPLYSFYSLTAHLITGELFSFESLRGKKVMIVNTASDCGYTPQYDGLQKIADTFPGLEVLVFPSNDFKNQEPGTDREIAEFCKLNYGLSLPVFRKSAVKKKPGQSAVFAWLTNAEMNGWNNREPQWNFNKFIVDEKGELVKVLGQSIDPLSKEMKSAIGL